MKIKYKKYNSGFTIVEILLTTALVGIIAIAGFGFNFFVNSYNLARDTFLYVYVYGDMERRAILGLDKMIHGVENHKGLQEARNATLLSSTRIEFVDGENQSLSREFYLSGGKVKYVDETGVIKDITGLLDEDVQTLIFSKPESDLITISLGLQKTAIGRTINVNVGSSVKLRNK